MGATADDIGTGHGGVGAGGGKHADVVRVDAAVLDEQARRLRQSAARVHAVAGFDGPVAAPDMSSEYGDGLAYLLDKRQALLQTVRDWAAVSEESADRWSAAAARYLDTDEWSGVFAEPERANLDPRPVIAPDNSEGKEIGSLGMDPR